MVGWSQSLGAPVTAIFKHLALVMLAMPLAAQTVARQATPADLRQGEFHSPMVFELPFKGLSPDAPGGFYSFTDQEKFICDDVSLTMVLVKASVDPGAKTVRLKITSTVFVRPSFDRKVGLHYAVLSAGATLEGGSDQDISAKERKFRSDSSTLDLPLDRFNALFLPNNPGVLKVVMTVTPDR